MVLRWLRAIALVLAGDAFGTSIARAGDINQDGKSDFIVGAPANDAVDANAGRAYVFLSHTAPAALEDDGKSIFIHTAPSGDVNNDGRIDADDLLAVIHAWGACLPGPCHADIHRDGQVAMDDLLIVITTMN